MRLVCLWWCACGGVPVLAGLCSRWPCWRGWAAAAAKTPFAYADLAETMSRTARSRVCRAPDGYDEARRASKF